MRPCDKHPHIEFPCHCRDSQCPKREELRVWWRKQVKQDPLFGLTPKERAQVEWVQHNGRKVGMDMAVVSVEWKGREMERPLVDTGGQNNA